MNINEQLQEVKKMKIAMEEAQERLANYEAPDMGYQRHLVNYAVGASVVYRGQLEKLLEMIENNLENIESIEIDE